MLVAPRVLYYMAKRELWSVPVVRHRCIPHTGAFPVDRGQPDREALRAGALAVLDNGQVLGVFVEGTRQKTGEIGNARAGASMLAMGAGVPVLPVCVRSGEGFGLPGFPPTSIAVGVPLPLSGRRGRARLQGRRRAHRGRAAAPRRLPARPRPGRSSATRAAAMSTDEQRAEEARAAAERRARREPPRARRRRGDPEVERGEAEPTRELAGTVAVVGFPNVGKSTLINRLAGRRETVVHEVPGVTRDRKDVDVEWNGRRSGSSTRAASTSRARASPARSRSQARQAVAEADLVLFVLDTRIGDRAGRRGDRRDPAAGARCRRSSSPTRPSPRAPRAGRRRVPRARPGRPVPVSGLHGTARATCST